MSVCIIELLEEIDGFANTGLIRGYHFSNGYSASYGAGIVDYEKGWYIPTAGQLMKLCSVLDKVNDKLSLAGGSRLQLKPYFSSSEASYSAQVWAVDFGNSSHDWGGQFETHYKNESACFRAVRNIIFSKAPTIADINIPDSFSVDCSARCEYALAFQFIVKITFTFRSISVIRTPCRISLIDCSRSAVLSGLC